MITKARWTSFVFMLLALAGTAQAETIEFTPGSDYPNSTGTPNTGAYGSDSIVSVGYSAYSYFFGHGYGTLDGGTGAAVYSDDTDYTFTMTFMAAAGYNVTLDSFNLGTFGHESGAAGTVDISVTGDTPAYTMIGAMPDPTTYTTYSPGVTGSTVTLTITNLDDVGINTIMFSESPASVPEPSTFLLMGLGLGAVGIARLRRGTRRQTA